MHLIYNQWLRHATEDPDILKELQLIKANAEKQAEYFEINLEFGTGGLRGILGAGTNRMNIYVVRRATQAVANYLHKKYSGQPISVAIAYDSRNKSELFAIETARVLAANQILVNLYSELMPTPALSYAVRKLNCSAGICITASHNPAQYNGYKVYGCDGCQIVTAAAKEIMNEINSLDIWKDIKLIDVEKAQQQGSITYINDEVVTSYLKAVTKESVFPIKSDIQVVYTPLNGAGRKCVTRMLQEIGVKNVLVVAKQELPDGNFPTCPYPNPEHPQAMTEGLDLCRRTGAELLLATDPDCDRVGVGVKHKEEYILLNGNEVGVLLLDYIAQGRGISQTLPKHPVAVKTIVTTDMARKVAKKYNIELICVLTGFKYIGEQIATLESEQRKTDFIFGFEESCGYLAGTYVRDKDGVNGCMLVCEMASYYKEKGLSLYERMLQLYQEFGFYSHSLLDFSFPGISGMEKMQKIMTLFRENKNICIGQRKLCCPTDYLTGIDNLPMADVLEYRFDDGAKIVIRPSGTEPKLKVYLTVCEQSKQGAEQGLTALEDGLSKLIFDLIKVTYKDVLYPATQNYL